MLLPRTLASLFFLFLLIAQFIAYFNFSNIAEVLAVKRRSQRLRT